jgi:GNAT superfamily N-acetyltransferase
MWRSKAYWGYDSLFMDAVRAEMQISGDDIAQAAVFILKDKAGNTVGFYRFLKQRLHLEDLFIEPEAIGKGYGKILFEHAVALARELGFEEFTLILIQMLKLSTCIWAWSKSVSVRRR